VQRAASSLHEELCRTDLQVRVQNVHEILREEVVKRRPSPRSTPMNKRVSILVAATLGSISVEAPTIAAENSRKLSGSQIRAKFAGMQLTDEVHFRDVYDRDGTLRSYSMGTKKVGKWQIQKDELCLYFKEPDDGCYEVSLSGTALR
jgi:hypothetical protein